MLYQLSYASAPGLLHASFEDEQTPTGLPPPGTKFKSTTTRPALQVIELPLSGSPPLLRWAFLLVANLARRLERHPPQCQLF